MKLLFSCLLLAAATLFTFGETGRILKPKYSLPKEDTRSIVIDINGETFYLGIGAYSWNESKAQCKLLGMQMITLATQERWEIISEWFRENREYDSWTWSSGQKLAGQEDFIWMTTGENFTYTDWNRDEPSRSPDEESCMNFIIGIGFLGKQSGWDDDTCENSYHVMCEPISEK